MGTVPTIFAVVVLIIVLVAAGFAVALVRWSKRQRQSSTALPFPSRAPEQWAGSHQLEAKLHRRIGDALRAYDNPVAIMTAAQLDDQVRLTIVAQELDDRLVTTAALAPEIKAERLNQMATEVADLERHIAESVSPGRALEGPQ